MLIVDKTRYGGEKNRRCTIQEVYDLLDNRNATANLEASNADSVQEIIAWLPSIRQIDVYCYFENSFLDIHLNSYCGECIRLYNTGIETSLTLLVNG